MEKLNFFFPPCPLCSILQLPLLSTSSTVHPSLFSPFLHSYFSCFPFLEKTLRWLSSPFPSSRRKTSLSALFDFAASPLVIITLFFSVRVASRNPSPIETSPTGAYTKICPTFSPPRNFFHYVVFFCPFGPNNMVFHFTLRSINFSAFPKFFS